MGLGIRQLGATDVLAGIAQNLGAGGESAGTLSTALVAAVVRRAAASTCPCPRQSIIDIAFGALHGLDESSAIKAMVKEVLDRLIVIGDLLELGGAPSVAGDWVYCAPPMFVRQEGSILILGIEAEDQGVMPQSLRRMLRTRRELRYIDTQVPELAAEQLQSAGYLEISRAAWTRLPLERTAEQFKVDVVRRLQESGGSGQLEGLKIIDLAKGRANFAARWTAPAEHTGYFVGRRPQAFGSPIWVFVEIDHGKPTAFIDLPWNGGRFRGCDQGWRIQSALDALAGAPQKYQVSAMSAELDRYEFSSPLPLWIERRLQLHGEKVRVAHALIAYYLPRESDHQIDELVQSRMWFTRSN